MGPLSLGNVLTTLAVPLGGTSSPVIPPAEGNPLTTEAGVILTTESGETILTEP